MKKIPKQWFAVILRHGWMGLALGSSSLLSSLAQTAGPLLEKTDIEEVALPSWTDSSGSVYLEDGFGNKRAMSWSPEGYVVVENGVVLEKFPEGFPEPPHTTNRVFYVDASSGSNSNDGLAPERAWRNLLKVNALSFEPGDEILLKRGETWTETLIVPSSGSDENVIKIGAYGEGDRPVIDGEGTRDYLLQTNGQENLWITGLRVTGGGLEDIWGVVDLQSDPRNIWMTDCEIDHNNQSGISVRAYSDGTYFRDLYIHDNIYNGLFLADMAWNAEPNDGRHLNHYTVNCEFANNGNKIKDESNRYGWNGTPTSGAMYGNLIYGTLREPLYFIRGGVEGTPTDTTFRIHDNVVHSIPGDEDGGFTFLFAKSSSMVYRNVVYGAGQSYGLASDQANGKDAVIYYHHNLVYDIDGAAIFQNAANAKEVPGGSFTIHAWNNTADENSEGFRSTKENQGGNDKVTLHTRNNIFSNSTNYAIRVQLDPVIESYDYNVYAGGGFAHADQDFTFGQWQGQGFDTHSLNLSGTNAPGYVDRANRDYELESNSPARGVGTDELWGMQFPASWIGINYVPHATSPDAGAYQYLAGKTLDFSKYFLGRRCRKGIATKFQLWEESLTEADLLAITADGAPLAPGYFVEYARMGDWVDSGNFMGRVWVESYPWVYQWEIGSWWYTLDPAGNGNGDPDAGAWVFVREW